MCHVVIQTDFDLRTSCEDKQILTVSSCLIYFPKMKNSQYACVLMINLVLAPINNIFYHDEMVIYAIMRVATQEQNSLVIPPSFILTHLN